MDAITSEILRALGYLLIACVASGAWMLAHKAATGGRIKTALLKGFGICFAIALFAAFSLGQPSCEGGDTDNYGLHCDQYADNGFMPSAEQREAQFAYFLTLLYVPVMFGAVSGRNRPHEV